MPAILTGASMRSAGSSTSRGQSANGVQRRAHPEAPHRLRQTPAESTQNGVGPRDVLVPALRIEADELLRRYAERLPEWRGASSIDQSQRTDLRSYMLDDILVKVDRMSMRHSLELRSPFIDYRMVELGLRVPSRLRAKNGRNKHRLRRLAARHLPEEVCAAPKRGFGNPLRSWLRDPKLAGSLRALLAEGTPGFPDPFLPGGANRLWDAAAANPALHTALVTMLCYRWLDS